MFDTPICERMKRIISGGVEPKNFLYQPRFFGVNINASCFWIVEIANRSPTGQTPFRIFWRSPLFTFSRKLSTKYFDCPKAMFNINKPCGVASNQNVGNLRERIKPRSTKWIILPPSTELRVNLSGCHEIMPSAFPLSINDSISANLIRPGSLVVLPRKARRQFQVFLWRHSIQEFAKRIH